MVHHLPIEVESIEPRGRLQKQPRSYVANPEVCIDIVEVECESNCNPVIHQEQGTWCIYINQSWQHLSNTMQSHAAIVISVEIRPRIRAISVFVKSPLEPNL